MRDEVTSVSVGEPPARVDASATLRQWPKLRDEDASVSVGEPLMHVDAFAALRLWLKSRGASASTSVGEVVGYRVALPSASRPRRACSRVARLETFDAA